MTVVLAGPDVRPFWTKLGFAAPARSSPEELVCSQSAASAAGQTKEVWLAHLSALQPAELVRLLGVQEQLQRPHGCSPVV